ncbi:2-phospho-L-lactate guanylyltransferase [Gordonia sp. (in: high G+C Gram-positive bacteria)]|uniref:2-phospho-L-lactate guanylyltransferase n=1 Tax=Gordonia sp. (in: high G+C Gram-positive bacteria) TaxID=84139 RepID=UPI002C38A175|nr:2-phospho-L-lactate guanylyltransferase [Gordonia sp. (in: high G+C Gram-positive bacteria)]HMS75025.1 2-phospho-L-lactate guanylyltransferase [Gordonia sp. (in: high G+C Gram-positive bacteria)]
MTMPANRPDHLPDPAHARSISTQSIEFVAILAVKSLADAKSRLTGWDDDHRRNLVIAMLADTIAAIHAAGCARVLVISPDPVVLAEAAACGASGLLEPTGPGRPGTPADGLNQAMADAMAAARRRRPGVRRLVLVQADLPAATGDQIRAALTAASSHRQAFVADRRGTGTALLVRDADLTTQTRFGADSAALHRLDGLAELDPGHSLWAGLRNDVDTIEDLTAAIGLGVGERTAQAVGSRSAGARITRTTQSSPTAGRRDHRCVMIDG